MISIWLCASTVSRFVERKRLKSGKKIVKCAVFFVIKIVSVWQTRKFSVMRLREFFSKHLVAGAIDEILSRNRVFLDQYICLNIKALEILKKGHMYTGYTSL